jgi:quercetin dioxygenase-like cupin family protein
MDSIQPLSRGCGRRAVGSEEECVRPSASRGHHPARGRRLDEVKRRAWALRALAAALATAGLAMAHPAAAQVGLERKILLRQDLAIPGYEALLVEVTLAVGGREGRHWHSGTLVGRVLEGELTTEFEGQPTKIIKAGDAFLIEPRQVHEGFNKGSVPVRALVTFINEKGQPLTTPTQ